MFEMDADFSHDPSHLPEFLRLIDSADLVIGSRYRDGKITIVNWPISRLLLSYFANVYARFVTRMPVWDTTAGFKCFRRRVLEAIDFSKVVSNGYAFQIEMHFRVWRKGFRMVEMPIVFVDRTEGQSKMSRKIMVEAFWMVLRLRWWAIIGRA
jgi:dolichol-phosphate mannosyltransferase